MLPNPLDMRLGGLFSGGAPKPPSSTADKVLDALYRAKVALYDAHALTRSKPDCITCTDSPYWRAFCDIERLFLDKREEVWEPGRN